METLIIKLKKEHKELNLALDAVLNVIDIIPAEANKMADVLRTAIHSREYDLEELDVDVYDLV